MRVSATHKASHSDAHEIVRRGSEKKMKKTGSRRCVRLGRRRRATDMVRSVAREIGPTCPDGEKSHRMVCHRMMALRPGIPELRPVSTHRLLPHRHCHGRRKRWGWKGFRSSAKPWSDPLRSAVGAEERQSGRGDAGGGWWCKSLRDRKKVDSFLGLGGGK